MDTSNVEMSPSFNLIIGLDKNNDITLDIISGLPKSKLTDIAELLFLFTSGALNDDLIAYLSRYGKASGKQNEINAILKLFKKLSDRYGEKPLIDSLQLMHGGDNG